MCINISEAEIRDIIDRFDKAESIVGNFFNTCCAKFYSDEIDEEAFDELRSVLNSSGYEMGVSKVCFFFDQYPDIVVKLPFWGAEKYDMSYDDDDEDHEDGEWYLEETVEYERACMDNSKREWDYCEKEALMYEEAKKHNVEEAFAETKCIGMTSSGYPIYVSEKISEHTSSLTRNLRDKWDKKLKTLHYRSRCSDSVVINLLGSYPVDLVLNILRFLYDFRVDGDMHSGNYRFNKDGHIVFIDYSDFNDAV